jgi:hypothetical protein
MDQRKQQKDMTMDSQNKEAADKYREEARQEAAEYEEWLSFMDRQRERD